MFGVFSVLVSVGQTRNIQVVGRVSLYGKPVANKKVFVRGPDFNVQTVTNKQGYYISFVSTKKDYGLFTVFTKNCLSDTLVYLKEYEPTTNRVVFNFKLCETVHNFIAKGKVTYGNRGLPNTKIKFAINNSNIFIDSVLTDSMGNYQKTLLSPSHITGALYASIEDCDRQIIQKSSIFTVNDTSTINFVYCRYNQVNLISGQVINSDKYIGSGDFTVTLYRYDSLTQQLKKIEEELCGMEGVFNFQFQNAGRFIVKAVPTSSNRFIPRYFETGWFWNYATPVDFKTQNIVDIQIHVPEVKTFSGTGRILGVVTDSRYGQMIEGKSILLIDEYDKPVAHCLSKAGGRFSFEGLTPGNYKVYLDEISIPTSAPTIVIDGNQDVSGLVLQVSNQRVDYKFEPTNIDKIKTFKGGVYPNPIENQLVFENGTNYTGSLHVYNLDGVLLHEATIGKNITSYINTEGWNKGFYIVKFVTPEEGEMFIKKIVK